MQTAWKTGAGGTTGQSQLRELLVELDSLSIRRELTGSRLARPLRGDQ